MRKLTLAACVAAMAALAASPAAFADGSETLGPPSIPVAEGTNAFVAGVGMHAFPGTQNTLSFSLPAGATVKQVLLYWSGHHSEPLSAVGDDTISVNGAPVTGTLIGGPTAFFQQFVGPPAKNGWELFSAYRADITDRGVVAAGANTLLISEMLFISNFPQGGHDDHQGNDGVGVLVIYENGVDSQVVGVRDGLDLAFAGAVHLGLPAFPAPLDATVPQTFEFSPAATPRPAMLSTMAGSVLGHDNPPPRANQLSITFAPVGDPVVLENPWQSSQGFEFDALNSPITIPAGASSMTVEAISGPPGPDIFPASLAWIGASLTIQNPSRQNGGQGCTPGYWKNHDGSKKQGNAWTATGYSPTDLLSSVFATGTETPAGTTMRQALDWGGGPTLDHKKRLLLHHAVAAVLNAAHPNVAYPMTTAQIISAVNSALASNDAATIENLKDQLDKQNNAGCPLGKV